jgi:hypothetical protein
MLRSRAAWLIFGLLNVFLLGLAALCFLHLFELVLIHLLQIVLRLSVTILWAFAVMGFPLVVWWIRRLRRGERRAFAPAKWWFSTVLLLVMVEPTSAVVEWRRDRLFFPEDLPAHPADEIHVVGVSLPSQVQHPDRRRCTAAEAIPRPPSRGP